MEGTSCKRRDLPRGVPRSEGKARVGRTGAALTRDRRTRPSCEWRCGVESVRRPADADWMDDWERRSTDNNENRKVREI